MHSMARLDQTSHIHVGLVGHSIQQLLYASDDIPRQVIKALRRVRGREYAPNKVRIRPKCGNMVPYTSPLTPPRVPVNKGGSELSPYHTRSAGGRQDWKCRKRTCAVLVASCKTQDSGCPRKSSPNTLTSLQGSSVFETLNRSTCTYENLESFKDPVRL